VTRARPISATTTSSDRRLRAALLAVALAATLTACTALNDTPGTEVRTITVGDEERSYRVHVPENLGAEPALVVMLHGGFGSGRQAERSYGWSAASDTHGFVVYPDGENRAWNAGDCCGRFGERLDDVAFIAALVADLQVEFGVTPERTFATGMSNGAMLAYRLACETDLFAAIAPVAGTIVVDCADPHPTSVLHIHGALDDRVRLDGERGTGSANVDGMPVADVIELWRTANGCAEPVTTTEGVITREASACADGRRVELVVIADSGHAWPGGVGREGQLLDEPSTALDATEEIWRFFDAA
jgi:polyhydroxybutyrate depolymerase